MDFKLREKMDMAIDDPEDDQEEGEVKKPKKKGKLLMVILIIFSILVTVGASIGGTLYFTGALSVDHVADSSSSDKKDKNTKKKSKSAPIYYAFDPPFVVNFIENNQIRYLQITLEVMTRKEDVVEELKTHMPVIRNNLVLVFSDQTYDTLSTAAGKQKLRDEALAEIQQVLKEQTGKPGVEAVYFTGFVMQ